MFKRRRSYSKNRFRRGRAIYRRRRMRNRRRRIFRPKPTYLAPKRL